MILPRSISENLMYSTVRIVSTQEDGQRSLGTGFFFDFLVDEKTYIPTVITCKHVVERGVRGEFLVHEGEEKGGTIAPSRTSIPILMDDFFQHWIYHPSPDVDLCAMPLRPLEVLVENQGKHLYKTALDETLIWPDDKLMELTALEEVVMVGYPIGLWDSANNFPLIRRGVTASHPAIDFDGKSFTVVDIACFPGSSGSPVLIVNEGTYYSKPLSVTVGNRAILLGVLFGGPQWTAEGQIVIKPIPTMQPNFVSVTPVMIHLGYIVKAKEILELGKALKRPHHSIS